MIPFDLHATAIPPLHIRLADVSDVQTLYGIRQAAILRLALTHLSTDEAADWAAQGGFARVEKAIENDEVLLALRDHQIVGWLHQAANSINGLYVSPAAARQGIGKSLMTFAERRAADAGHEVVVLRSSLNAEAFYLRLGYVPVGARSSSAGISMSKRVVA